MTDHLAPGDDGVVVLDRYPVTVTVDGAQHRGVRAIATRTHLYVFARDGREVRLDLVAPYDPATAVHVGPNVPRFRTSRVDLVTTLTDDAGQVVGHAARDDGHVLIAPDEGCGCRNPLVGFVPWQPYVRGALRTV